MTTALFTVGDRTFYVESRERPPLALVYPRRQRCLPEVPQLPGTGGTVTLLFKVTTQRRTHDYLDDGTCTFINPYHPQENFSYLWRFHEGKVQWRFHIGYSDWQEDAREVQEAYANYVAKLIVE